MKATFCGRINSGFETAERRQADVTFGCSAAGSSLASVF